MTQYQWREDDMFDLQRMPGTRRYTSHTPERKDPTIHTFDHPFCYDLLCSTCRQKEIQHVLLWFEQGLLTEHEAVEFLAGRTL